MKLRLFTTLSILLFSTALLAQREPNKIGYVDMDYILDNLSDYKEANNQLNQKIEQWKGEIELKQQKISGLKEDLENERPLLTQDLIDERQDEIEYYQKKLLEFQQEKFGPEGAMIAQRRQIMQPIQDEVFNAVQEIGTKREYDFIFDSSADALMLFSAKRHDISDQILAGIRRNSRKFTSDKKEEDAQEEEAYKSVKQARLDKEKEEEREAAKKQKEDERQQMIDQRQRERDSIRDARQADMQARRDSIAKERADKMKNRSNSGSSNTKKEETGQKDNTDLQPQNTDTPKETEPARKTNSATSPETDRQQEIDDRKAQREAQQQKRQQERDSIQQARQKELEKRKIERDSIIQARNLERENRKK